VGLILSPSLHCRALYSLSLLLLLLLLMRVIFNTAKRLWKQKQQQPSLSSSLTKIEK